jgi:hypothetical protein
MPVSTGRTIKERSINYDGIGNPAFFWACFRKFVSFLSQKA